MWNEKKNSIKKYIPNVSIFSHSVYESNKFWFKKNTGMVWKGSHNMQTEAKYKN